MRILRILISLTINHSKIFLSLHFVLLSCQVTSQQPLRLLQCPRPNSQAHDSNSPLSKDFYFILLFNCIQKQNGSCDVRDTEELFRIFRFRFARYFISKARSSPLCFLLKRCAKDETSDSDRHRDREAMQCNRAMRRQMPLEKIRMVGSIINP